MAHLLFRLDVVLRTCNNKYPELLPPVVATLGFNRVDSLLLTVPPYILGVIVTVGNNLSADYFRNSSYHVMWPPTVAIVGYIIAITTLNTGARYLSMCLMIAGGHGANAVIMAWSQKTMLRPRIKRSAVAAFVNASGNTAQVSATYAPWLSAQHGFI